MRVLTQGETARHQNAIVSSTLSGSLQNGGLSVVDRAFTHDGIRSMAALFHLLVLQGLNREPFLAECTRC
jgi:hypothetical protein